MNRISTRVGDRCALGRVSSPHNRGEYAKAPGASAIIRSHKKTPAMSRGFLVPRDGAEMAAAHYRLLHGLADLDGPHGALCLRFGRVDLAGIAHDHHRLRRRTLLHHRASLGRRILNNVESRLRERGRRQRRDGRGSHQQLGHFFPPKVFRPRREPTTGKNVPANVAFQQIHLGRNAFPYELLLCETLAPPPRRGYQELVTTELVCYFIVGISLVDAPRSRGDRAKRVTAARAESGHSVIA